MYLLWLLLRLQQLHPRSFHTISGDSNGVERWHVCSHFYENSFYLKDRNHKKVSRPLRDPQSPLQNPLRRTLMRLLVPKREHPLSLQEHTLWCSLVTETEEKAFAKMTAEDYPPPHTHTGTHPKKHLPLKPPLHSSPRLVQLQPRSNSKSKWDAFSLIKPTVFKSLRAKLLLMIPQGRGIYLSYNFNI